MRSSGRLYYPIMLSLEGKKVLVVGGGKIAEQKIGELLNCGASVTVIAPEIAESIRSNKKIKKSKRKFKAADVAGHFLVIGATSLPDVNRRIAKAARRYKKLVNIVDMPRLCDYIMPSVIRSGKLAIAVSTSGAAPFYSKWLADRMRRNFKKWWGSYLDLVEPVRRRVIDRESDPEKRKIILAKMTNTKILNLVRQDRIEEAKSALEEIAHGR